MRRLPLVGCQQFVVIPGLNVWNEGQPGTSQTFMRSASRLLRSATRATIMLSLKQTDLRMTLLDEVAPHETMLVSMDETQRINLLRAHPGLRVVPVSRLTPMWLQRFLPVPSVAISAAAKVAFEVKVVDGVTGVPMEGIDVVGLSSRADRTGASDRTNKRGIATLMFPAGVRKLESVEAYPPSRHWPAHVANVSVSSGTTTLACAAIDLARQDIRGHFGFSGSDRDGQGVKVGVIDTGVAKHSDLRVAKGLNVVKGERATDYADQVGHGTHVCGIVAGRGVPGKGVRGARSLPQRVSRLR